MTFKNGGPSVVPVSQSLVEQGMTLRDYFAAAALQGLMGDPKATELMNGDSTKAALGAYTIADAMLAERNK